MIRTAAAYSILVLPLLLAWEIQSFAPSSSALSSNTISLRWSHSRRQQQHRQPQQQQLPASVIEDPPSSTPQKSSNEDEDVRKSIEAMRLEAKRRLEALSKEMSEYTIEATTKNSTAKVTTKPSRYSSSSSSSKPEEVATKSTYATPLNSMDSMEGDLTKFPLKNVDKQNKQKDSVQTSKAKTNREKKQEDIKKAAERVRLDIPDAIRVNHADVNLLDDTRWKIVFDLGREPGTWMPKTWGASGDRLRFSVVVDLTSEPFYEREEFFDGVAGAKVLKVVEANLGPSFWGSQNHGQQQLKVKSTGGYKVMRGGGPMGTDALRFFIETEEEIFLSSRSDVSCPKGRIYGNCGYFPVYSSLDDEHPHTNWKEMLQKDYHAVASRYDLLQREADEDERVFSVDQIKRMKEMMDTRKTLKKLEQRIQEAKQRDPERSQLRLSRRGDVGLSKEGGVCLKVQKGLAIEYHILGRMEVASFHKEIPPDHEDYEDLVHKLHP